MINVKLAFVSVIAFFCAASSVVMANAEDVLDLSGLERVPHIMISLFNALFPVILFGIFIAIIYLIAPSARRWLNI